MRRPPSPTLPVPTAGRLLTPFLLAALAASGCGHEEEAEYVSVAQPPTVRLMKPELRTIVRTVGQPSFVEAYERTSVFPKLTAYIDEWVVDIGDKVRKGDVLAKLFVPELVEDYETKNATVKLDEEKVELKKKLVDVAAAEVEADEARVVEAKAILGKFDAEVERWDTEVKRLKREVDRNVVDPQILLESTNQWKSAKAARDAAVATIDKAEAELLSSKATLAEAKVDVRVAEAALAVATSEWKRLGALVGYLTLPAPFDGVVFARNANTFDFVLPTTGDPTADAHAPHLSPSGAAAPIYVIDRTDIVRIFVDIPERDANYVHGVDLRLVDAAKEHDLPTEGRDLIVLARMGGMLHIRIFGGQGKLLVKTDEKQLAEQGQEVAELKAVLKDLWGVPRAPGADKKKDKIIESWAAKVSGEQLARISPVDKDKVTSLLVAMFGPERVPVGSRANVLVKGYRDEPIPGIVTRTSWALNVKSRTLRAEIDLKNPGSQLLPGMYAYAKVIIERPGVHALPESALTRVGDQTFCWTYKDGVAVRTPVQTGVSDGKWIEVTNLHRETDSAAEYPWQPFTGSEQVILGDLSVLADGGPVQVATGEEKEEVATAHPGAEGRPKAARPAKLVRTP